MLGHKVHSSYDRLLCKLSGLALSPLVPVKKYFYSPYEHGLDREEEIQNFIPQEYWTMPIDFIKNRKVLTANFYSYNGEKIKLENEKDVSKVRKAIKGETFKVTDISKAKKNHNTPNVYITSTMQQDASRKINFKTRKTMSVAQELYEGINLKKLGGITGLC